MSDPERPDRPATGGEPPPPPEPPILITDDMLVRREPVDARIDFERGMSYAPPLTLLLIAANVGVFIWEVGRGALASEEAIIAAGALSRARILEGEWWRLVTPMFLHGSPDHLIGNCIVLYILGMACEHAFGSRPMLGTYLWSGMTASLLSLGLSPGPSVGASGAIFGVMAAVIVVLYRYQHVFYLRDKRIGLVLVAWAVYTIVTGLMTPYVDNAAHAGGFLGGALLAQRLKPRAVAAHASAGPGVRPG